MWHCRENLETQRWEEKVIPKRLQMLLAQQRNSFGKCPRAFFRIMSTFELDRKLATTILFLIGIPKQRGHTFGLLIMPRKTNKPRWRQHSGGYSQPWAAPSADTGEANALGRLLNQGTCSQKTSYNQSSFDSEQLLRAESCSLGWEPSSGSFAMVLMAE